MRVKPQACLSALAVGWLALAPPASARVPRAEFFEYRTAAVGFADHAGHPHRWWLCDYDIMVGGEFTLPVRFLLTSRPHDDAPCLGAFMWYPLLESVLVVKDDEVIANFPGGYPRALHYDPGSKKICHASGSDITGEWKDDKIFEIHNEHGWTLRYESGRLVRFTSPKGTVVQWIYEKGRTTRIVGPGGELFAADYRPDGLLEKTRYKTAEGRPFETSFSYAECPKVIYENGKPKVSGNVPVMSALFDTEGFSQSLPVVLSDDLKTLEKKVDFVDNTGKARHDFYRWSTETGFILADHLSTYEITKPDEASGAHTGITRIYADGTKQGYLWNDKTGLRQLLRKDGSIDHELFSVKDDPSHGKLLERRNKNSATGSDRLLYKAEYDEKGRMSREADTEDVRDYEYDSSGYSMTLHDPHGKFLQKRRYDKMDRLVGTEFSDGTTLIHTFQPDGTHSSVRTTPRGFVTTDIYNESEDLAERSYSDGTHEHYFYFSPGRLRERTDRKGVRWRYQYTKDYESARWEGDVLRYAAVFDSLKRRWYGIEVNDSGAVMHITDIKTKRELEGQDLNEMKSRAGELFDEARKRMKPPADEAGPKPAVTTPAPKAP